MIWIDFYQLKNENHEYETQHLQNEIDWLKKRFCLLVLGIITLKTQEFKKLLRIILRFYFIIHNLQCSRNCPFQLLYTGDSIFL